MWVFGVHNVNICYNHTILSNVQNKSSFIYTNKYSTFYNKLERKYK